MDRLTKEQRHKNMQAVKNKDSKIELLLRSALWKKGYRYSKNSSKLEGKPDIVLPKYKTVIFCDSEFWHGYDWKRQKNTIKSNKKFWIKKIEGNIKRDKEVNKILKSQGWKVLRFWGKDIQKNLEKCINKIEKEIKSSNSTYSLDNDNEKVLTLEEEQLLLFKENFNNKFIPCKSIPFPAKKDTKFTFIDLFSGIGGMRIAFQNLGGKCVFSSEIDEQAKKTYAINFGEIPEGDITRIDAKNIPDHDILVGGFPCQAFSIAGKRGGFNDTRGTLFFDIARIIKTKQPKAFFLENVKGLTNHRGGKTLETILNVLRNDLKYVVPDPQIMNAKDFGVPQNRERIFIVGFRNDLGIKETDFSYPKPTDKTKTIRDILEEKPVSAKYYLSTKYIECLEKHKARNESKGNGFGYEIKDLDGVSNTIVTGGMGRERNRIIDKRLKDFTPVTHIKGEVNRIGLRRMTPREWARLQGFPDKFKIEVSDVSAYKQFGNSVAIPAVQATAKKIVEKIIEE